MSYNTINHQFSQILGFTNVRMIEEMKNIAEATSLLSKEAGRDSEVMKIVTVITMVYLPATFVCVSQTSCLIAH
jgi:Mg2+ and Co2+ transporter CorA